MRQKRDFSVGSLWIVDSVLEISYSLSFDRAPAIQRIERAEIPFGLAFGRDSFPLFVACCSLTFILFLYMLVSNLQMELLDEKTKSSKVFQ